MTRTRFSEEERQAFEPDAKIGLLATLDEGGLPHVSLITTLRACEPAILAWGQFCEGHSKRNVQERPQTAFLVMNMQRRIWRGRARWTHLERRGPELARYNQRPMFRYNAYFGIHTVHFMDLVSIEPPQDLAMPALIGGSLGALAASPLARLKARQAALKPWARALLLRPDTLKFLAWVEPDGFPTLVPAVPAAPAGGDRLVIGATGQRRALRAIPTGCTVALFALNLQMESVLLRGTLGRFRGPPGLELASLTVDWVYNSMPPKQGQVFPMPPLQAVM